MKRTLLMFAAAGLLIATPSCKKGENDPFMSLSSRKSRISGTWNMTMMDMTTINTYDFAGSTYVNTDVTTYDSSVDDSVRTNNSVTVDGGTPTTSYSSSSQQVTHTFAKDGAYDYNEIVNGNTWQASGFWAFVGKSKTTDLKKKEAVMITYTQTISSGNTNTYTGNSMFPDGYFLLDRLSGKEMIVKIDQTNTYSNGDSYSATGTITFAKE